MATPATFALDLYEGDTYRWQFRVWLDEAKTQPADLEGVVAEAQIRDKPGGVKVTQLDCGIVGPNAIDVSLTGTAWVGMVSKGSWDLQLTYPSGDVATIVAGAVKVTADVTEGVAP